MIYYFIWVVSSGTYLSKVEDTVKKIVPADSGEQMANSWAKT